MKKTQPKNDAPGTPIKINRNRSSGKKRADLFARLRNTEHPLDNIFPNAETSSETTASFEQPILSHYTSSNPTQTQVQSKPVSPVKDFQKVPNSITRDAIPNKFFKGTSKSTYDALYLKTRGAVSPVRIIKATKKELMKWIGISHVTIFKHLKHLESVGLIRIEQRLGSHDGSVYEILIPEEAEPAPTHTNPSYPIPSNPILSNDSLSNTILYNKVVCLPYNKIVWDSMGNPIENKGTYESPNTSLKTLKSDDDAFAVLRANFAQISREVTGKELCKSEKEQWGKLSELLILELRAAIPNAKSISSVPAFLTEILRRKLHNHPHRAAQQRVRSDTVGKTVSVEYEIKDLDAQEREAALEQLRQFADDDFLEDFKKWYTESDWNWLLKELKIK